MQIFMFCVELCAVGLQQVDFHRFQQLAEFFSVVNRPVILASSSISSSVSVLPFRAGGCRVVKASVMC